MAKNNVTTKGYFIKRLRDNGFFVAREYYRYGEDDPRRWSVVINPEDDSLFITCYDNGEWPYRGLYEFNDGGRKFPKNYHINTDSMEVIISHLNQFKVEAKELNIKDGTRRHLTKQETKAAKEAEPAGQTEIKGEKADEEAETAT